MNIEQFLQSKSKEEIAFIFWDGGNYKKCNCMFCNFFEKDEYGILKCRSLFQEGCRKEYYNWLNKEIKK